MAGVPVTWSNPVKGALSNQVNAIQRVVSIASATESGTTVTITSNSHGFSNGQQVTIRGVTVVGYDGIFTITGTTTNTFTYTNTVSGLGASGAAGTATVPFGNATATFTSGGVSASCGTGSADVAVDASDGNSADNHPVSRPNHGQDKQRFQRCGCWSNMDLDADNQQCQRRLFDRG